MAEIAVSKLTQVVNHAAIGNCFVAVQKGAGVSSTNRASVSALQVDYTRIANAYPGVNGDGNARGNRTVTGNGAVPAGNVNDMWYDYSSALYGTSPLSGARIIREETPATWTYINEIYAKNAGTWKQVQEAWIKDTGAWRRFLYVVVVPSFNLFLNGNYTNLNLRSYYQQQTGDYTQTPRQVNFVLQTGTIGSNSTAAAALVTGVWPAGSQVVFYTQPDTAVAGMGGDAGSGPAGTCHNSGNCTGCCTGNLGEGCSQNGLYRKQGYTGGPCVVLNYPLIMVNNGTMGGGGGGSGSAGAASWAQFVCYAGGGGAGLPGGYGGGPDYRCRYYGASRNTSYLYGQGGWQGIKGGDLGQYGMGSTVGSDGKCSWFNGGAPGACIVQNGHAWELYGNGIAGPLG